MAVEVKGLDELKRKFEEIPKALRARVLRNALAAGARLVRDEAKRNAPVLSGSIKAPYRKPGTVKNAIKVRTSKMDRRAGNVGVFVNVKPLPGNKWKSVTTSSMFGAKTRRFSLVKKSQRGAQNPNDPYYWRWLEFGTKKMAARSFLESGAKRLGDALKVFETQVASWINKVDNGGPIK